VKPLQENPKRKSEASSFHREVFKAYGGLQKLCYLCWGGGATDAAHVIARSQLGPLRYASPRLARPAHRSCHEMQEAGRVEFELAIRRDAAFAHNEIAKVKIQVPEE